MSLQHGNVPKRWLAGAFGWAVLCGIVAFTMPVVHSNIIHLTPFGRAIATPNQTLYESNHTLVYFGGALIVGVLVVATAELFWRLHIGRSGRGFVTTIAASCVMAFSIFGFIFGILSIGAVALLALLSAIPIKDAHPGTPLVRLSVEETLHIADQQIRD